MTDHPVIHHPHITEKTMDAMDFDNKLQFIVNTEATKYEIADAIEEQYDVIVDSVNTQIMPQGEKKAIIQLSDDDNAQDVASRIGVF